MKQSYRLYLQEVIDFLDSVVIKFTPFEKMLNEHPDYQHLDDVDEYDPTTWPYYRILAGDVSLLTTTVYCWVPSLQREKELTKENLASYPDILTFYLDNRPDQREVLLSRYPNDRFLIKRILNPVINLDQAINAPNLTLLETQYREEHLSVHEQDDLIIFLQEFLQEFDYRWYINVFEYEDLYPVTFWSMLWYVLPMVLNTRRILNIKTESVHPYHIWEYLSSVGFGSYRGYLSRTQEMFLYRNDRFLKFSVGKQFMLKILKEVFLNPIRYSLAEKMVVNHTEERAPHADRVPEIMSSRGGIGEGPNYHQSYNLNLFMVELYKQGFDQSANNRYFDQVADQFSKAPVNELRTKFLEVIRNAESTELMLLLRFVLDSIVYLISVNRLEYSLTVVSHVTGDAVTFDNVVDALNFFYYLVHEKNLIEDETDKAPVYLPTKYTSTSAIAVSDYPVPDEYIISAGFKRRLRSYIDVEQFFESLPLVTGSIHSPMDLSYQLGTQFDWVFERTEELRNITDDSVYNAHLSLYRSVIPEQHVITLPQRRTTYEEFFTDYPEARIITEALEVENDYHSVMLATFESICPLVYGFTSLAESNSETSVLIHKLMELFTYLISYNVAIVGPMFEGYDDYLLPPLTAKVEPGEGFEKLHPYTDQDAGFAQHTQVASDISTGMDIMVGDETELTATDYAVGLAIENSEVSDEMVDTQQSSMTIYANVCGAYAFFEGDNIP